MCNAFSGTFDQCKSWCASEAPRYKFKDGNYKCGYLPAVTASSPGGCNISGMRDPCTLTLRRSEGEEFEEVAFDTNPFEGKDYLVYHGVAEEVAEQVAQE
eukprot:TRINITY_DN954_c0_g1_i1.p1 TRINITY_DN954_c0_g1~~TRINITY_DN954_c0_g1_i1.p1  ORF type:complete len:100 (-),score=35.29 TRINITY_DN954_c0_g1_i1:74-373(-)